MSRLTCVDDCRPWTMIKSKLFSLKADFDLPSRRRRRWTDAKTVRASESPHRLNATLIGAWPAPRFDVHIIIIIINAPC